MRAVSRFLATGVSAFLLSIVAAPALAGPQSGSYWHVTPLIGYAFYDNTTHVPAHPGVTIKDNIYYGGRVGYFFSPMWGIEAQGGSSPTQIDTTQGENVGFWHVGGDLVFVPLRTSRFDWHFLAGAGHSNLGPSSGEEKLHATTFDLGTGFRWWMSDAFAIHAEARNMLLAHQLDDLDEARDNVVTLAGGLTYAFGGRRKDSDEDGIADPDDKCPNTPPGAHVDASGCPIDSDHDGVYDGIDSCPDTPAGATVSPMGCPSDADGDGVFDGLDVCADTPRGASVTAEGCPIDSDVDGVPDGIDQCDNTPRGATVSANGCPSDEDNDGVPDGIDQCPGTAAGLAVDARGCPATQREIEFLKTGTMRIQNITFATGKAELAPESYEVLDQVGNILTKWPELKIEVGGHTDSRGSAAANQKLSQERARSVLTYLTGKFPSLDTGQFSVKGYGESKPVAKNDTPAHMALNRRVEFKVLNKEDLKREVEKRKTTK